MERTRDLLVDTKRTAILLEVFEYATPPVGELKKAPIELKEEYLKNAGGVAQSQAIIAAKRLAKLLDECLDAE